MTGVLTQRGLFNGESESFGGFLWGPVATVGVAFGPQTYLLETESGLILAPASQSP